MIAVVNGQPVDDATISVLDRGLAYGDGLFETMRWVGGTVQSLDLHLDRLRLGCERLGMAAPAMGVMSSDLATLCQNASGNGVIKYIVTRGVGGRGYRASPRVELTRVAFWSPMPEAQAEIVVRWCATRLARNPQLAGIKHLNRLEQVLAQNEWHDERISEGLMLDTEGELVCATAANVFLVLDGALVTPDLRFCGIRGVMRQRVLAVAHKRGLSVEERSVWPDEVAVASEVLVTNAVRGVRSVVALDVQRWSVGPVAQYLRDAVGDA